MTKNESPKILGVIVAGGLSRRMDGGDKGLVHLGTVSILERIARRIRPQQVDDLVLNANGDDTRLASLSLPILPDTVANFPGPLVGCWLGSIMRPRLALPG